MASQFFLRDLASDVTNGSNVTKQARITRGAASVTKITNTVAGPTAGVQVTNGAGAAAIEWYSDPLRGGQSLSAANLVTFNIRALESAVAANVGMQVRVELVDRFGTVISTIVDSERGTEVGTTDAANNWTLAATATTINHGNRLKITVLGNDIGTMGSGRTFTISYDGATAGAAGDSYVQFVETLTYGGQQYAQAQATIKAFPTQYAQAQADVKSAGRSYSQAQADIQTTSRQYAQANAYITGGPGYAQAAALISGSFTGLTETFTRSVTDSWGTSDSGSTYTILTGAAADFDVDGANGTIRNPSTAHHIRMPRVSHTPNVEVTFIYSANAIGSAHTTQFRTHLGSNDTTDTFDSGLGINLVEATNTGHLDIEVNGQSTVTGGTISPLSAGVIYGIKYQAVVISSRILIRTKFWVIGFTEPYWSGVSTELPFTIPVGHMGLRVTGTTLANLLNFASITVTEGFLQGLGQANADIKAVGSKFGQAKADIKTQGFGLGQAQASIKAAEFGSGQAQADINAVGYGFSQAQADIKATSTGFGQALALIPNWFSAQAQALIGGTYSYPVIDDFGRVVTNGLGPAPNGDSYTLITGTASNANVNGSVATIQAEGVSGGNHEQSLQATLVAPSNGIQISFIGSFDRIPAIQMSISVSILGSGDQAGAGEYTVNLNLSPTGNISHSVNIRRVTGVTGFNSGSSTAYTVNDQYNIVAQIIKASGKPYTRSKAWKVGTSEPNWNEGWSFNAPTEIPLPGHPSLIVTRDSGATPVTTSIDSLKIIDAWITASGQAQSDIKATGRSFGQAQADIKATVSAPAQAQAQILKSAGYAQAAAAIKHGGSAQAQALINGTYNEVRDTFTRTIVDGLGQNDTGDTYIISAEPSTFDVDGSVGTIQTSAAQVEAALNNTLIGRAGQGISIRLKFKVNARPDSSNRLLTIYTNIASNFDSNGVQLTLTDSTTTFLVNSLVNGVGGNNASTSLTLDTWYTIEATFVNSSGSSVAARYKIYPSTSTPNAYTKSSFSNKKILPGHVILQKNFVFGATYPLVSLDDLEIVDTSWTESGQAQAKIIVTTATETYASAQAQADIKAVGFGSGQSNADIKAIGNGFGQANADIKAIGYGFAQAQATIRGNSFAQAQAGIKQTYTVSGQSQADIKVISNSSGQSQADIKATSTQSGQSIADIRVTQPTFGQAQADIKQIQYGFANSQADIKTTTNAFAQANADVKATQNSFAQANADIKTQGFGSGQSQADIKVTSFSSGQSQADIKVTSRAYSQANADIKAIGYSFGQSQADIKAVGFGFGQAQATIRGNSFAQAQAAIKTTQTAFAQSQADIKSVGYGFGQANATILGAKQQFAQAQADIKAKSSSWAQANADIKAVGRSYGQALALIGTRTAACAQAQARIKATPNAFAQGQATIRTTQTQSAQAQADIRATYNSSGQALAHIVVTSSSSAQALGHIKTIDLVANAQSQAEIKQSYIQTGQAQADIQTVYSQSGNAQADIKQNVINVAQAQASIQTIHTASGQALAQIQTGGFASAQAAGLIRLTENGFAQAQALIGKSAGYAQAVGYIFQPHELEALEIFDFATLSLALSDVEWVDNSIIEISEITLALSDVGTINLVLSDRVS
jgi:hypothetical protein